ncbi:pentatricopeptide repeat-containing protein 2, mitochondrial [Pogona vitticeps]
MAAALFRRSDRMLREATKYFKLGVVYSGCWNCRQGAKRYLLPENILQLQTFQQSKLQVAQKRYGEKDTFFRTLEEKLKNHRIILKDELKTLLHLCQSKSDVEIAKKVLYRYHEENKNMLFQEFRFGPVFMRLCYELDLEELGLELIKDQALSGFFQDSTSFNILMDILFMKGHYESALEVLSEMKRQNIKFNRETYLLACAICYKLNSAESCRICATLLEGTALKGFSVPRRGYYFVVALFLKQDDVAKARLYYSQIIDRSSQLCHNLNILLQAASGDTYKLIETLENTLDCNTPHFVRKVKFSMEVLQVVREKLDNCPDVWDKFESVFTKLQELGQITPQTLDDLLCCTPGLRKHDSPFLRQREMRRRAQRSLSSTLLSE